MALSMHEQRVLAEMEQRLADDDPRLASIFSRFSAAQHRIVGLRPERPAATATVSYPKAQRAMITRPPTLRRWTPWIVLVVGAALLGLGVGTAQVVISLAGSVLVAATPLLIPASTRLRPVGAPHPGADVAGRRGLAGLRPWWGRTPVERDRSRELT
jgi:hypothetical protein